ARCPAALTSRVPPRAAVSGCSICRSPCECAIWRCGPPRPSSTPSSWSTGAGAPGRILVGSTTTSGQASLRSGWPCRAGSRSRRASASDPDPNEESHAMNTGSAASLARGFLGATGRRLAVLLLAGTPASSALLDVKHPNNVNESDLNNPASAASQANGALSSLARAWGIVQTPYAVATDEQ